LGDTAISSREANRRFKRVAALVTEGLKTTKDAIPQLSANGQQELLRFMTSLLETYFFPRGHGLIEAQDEVLRQSQKATVEIPVEAKDGSRWRFEHRVRLYLSEQIGFRKRGDHYGGSFSSIRLFTRELHKTTPRGAASTALHEMTHMTFAMIRHFEQWLGTIGAEGGARLLSRQPWRLLDLSGFAGHRGNLERHARDLLRVLPIPMQAAELAASLVEEAFAFMFVVIVDEAIARLSRGPVLSSGFSPEQFIRDYVLERAFNVHPKLLKARGAQQIFQGMTSDVNALATAIRTHLGG
jgi:hypothetical protein